MLSWLHYIINMREMDMEQFNLNSKQVINKKQSGNITVLTDKYIHLSIGPHYKQLLLGFIILLMYEFGLLLLSYTQTNGVLHKQVGSLICALAPLCYLSTALRNPGLYDPSECHQPKTRYCQKCQHFITPDIRHCNYCNVCIIGYDHHCMWLSKCVGRNNITAFYSFIASLTLLNVYMYYTLYIMFWAAQ